MAPRQSPTAVEISSAGVSDKIRLPMAPRVASVLQVARFVERGDLQRWRARILRDRRRWRPCFDNAFSTYGVAWYVELEDGSVARYHAEAQRWNEHFRTFPRLRRAVERIASLFPRRVPVRPRRRMLGPYWADFGFTVYDHAVEGGTPHTDLEGLIPYPSAMFKATTEAFSATIAVECPKSGGGLWIDESRRRLGHYEPPHSRKGWRLLNCEPGTLTVFDSFLPHAIQSCRVSSSAPRRIMLVVHFLYRAEPYPHYQYWF